MPPVTTQTGQPAELEAAAHMAPPFTGPTNQTAPEPFVGADQADDEDEGDGEVAAVFEADVLETEAALAALSRNAQEQKKAEEFPLDAFIIPEHARTVPHGLEGQPPSSEPENSPVRDLADRLEKLSHRLRVEESEAVISRLAQGDKLDAMLAGLLAGILAAAK